MRKMERERKEIIMAHKAERMEKAGAAQAQRESVMRAKRDLIKQFNEKKATLMKRIEALKA